MFTDNLNFTVLPLLVKHFLAYIGVFSKIDIYKEADSIVCVYVCIYVCVSGTVHIIQVGPDAHISPAPPHCTTLHDYTKVTSRQTGAVAHKTDAILYNSFLSPLPVFRQSSHFLFV